MPPESLRLTIQWSGGLSASVALGFVLYGLWRGSKRAKGRTVGRAGSWLKSPWFVLVYSLLFFGLAGLGWIPLPLREAPTLRAWMLIAGSLLYFPGLTLLLWGRVALGENYFVSSGFGAVLFADQRLVTTGPYAFVRHPMYVGLILAALGSLLIYTTWTTLIFACLAPLMVIRARREETVLAAEFGEQWQAYCQRVPAFMPRLRPTL